MATEVVKVQRPIAASMGAGGPWLVYDASREHMVTIEPPPAVVRAMGDDLKAYFDAVWVEDHWVIGARTRNQAW